MNNQIEFNIMPKDPNWMSNMEKNSVHKKQNIKFKPKKQEAVNGLCQKCNCYMWAKFLKKQPNGSFICDDCLEEDKN